MSKPVSPKQIDLLRRLGADEETITGLTGGYEGTASAMIDRLLAGERSARNQAAAAAPKAAPGYYIAGDDVFVVVESRANPGRTYAKQLIIRGSEFARKSGSWEYRPGSVVALAGLKPLTAVEAGRLGHLHGHCIMCMTALEDPQSVAYGIGPSCYKKVEGRSRPKLAAAELVKRLEGLPQFAHIVDAYWDAQMQAKEAAEAERVAEFKSGRDEQLALV